MIIVIIKVENGSIELDNRSSSHCTQLPLPFLRHQIDGGCLPASPPRPSDKSPRHNEVAQDGTAGTGRPGRLHGRARIVELAFLLPSPGGIIKIRSGVAHGGLRRERPPSLIQAKESNVVHRTARAADHRDRCPERLVMNPPVADIRKASSTALLRPCSHRGRPVRTVRSRVISPRLVVIY